MLTHIVITSGEYDPDPMTLYIDGVEPDERVILKSISGLTPGNITLYTGDFARAGSYYQGRRPGKRNPVLTLKLNPDYVNDVDISEIRSDLYHRFLEKGLETGDDGVLVILYDDKAPTRVFVGYTEVLDPEMFSKSTDTQVSLIATEPYLLARDLESFYSASGLLQTTIDYQGGAKAGIHLELRVKNNTSQANIELGPYKMVLNRNFVTGDLITIRTIEGQRYIRVNGVDVMAALTGASRWLTLHVGDNFLKTYGTVSGDGKIVVERYNYRATWWGV